MQRRTLTSSFVRRGVGVHSGAPCTVTVGPGTSGLVFVVGAVRIPARVEHVVGTTSSTTLGRDGARVATVEHLLSALLGLGVMDAEIAVEGPELPILDGSARPWAEAIRGHSVAGPVERWNASVVVELSERDGLSRLGPRRVEFDFDRDDYTRDVAWARTFVYEADVERLLAQGRGAGATRENTVIIGATDGPVPRTRGPSEPARHKLLDALGDLALLGRPPRGRVVFRDGGHAAHVAEVRRRSGP